ncbi:MAG: hypothetical protein PWP65_1679 [Clostridia bacterium]|nr:hypothetical protein [Clostridia bacterium]
MIPRRRQEIASSVAEVIDKELLPWREIVQGLYRPEIEARLTEAVVQVAGRRFIERLPSFLPPKVKETIARLLENSLRQELPAALRELEELLLSSRGINFSLGKLAARKINSLDLEQAEKIILQVASRELRYIELVGGVLGFLIGLVQAALLR